ncbi:P-loop containing nucleoside triphosphate hydrolase protein [Mycena polygramma]|nr:P-loop containing nucleoside triphosphate hydrolase protein [Mycena polygramma]
MYHQDPNGYELRFSERPFLSEIAQIGVISRSPVASSLCFNDSSFGPQSLCRSFDFTVTFEAFVLLILPSTIFIGFAAPYLWIKKPWKNFHTSRAKNPRSLAILTTFFLLIVTAILSLVSWLISSPELPTSTKGLVTAALALKVVSSGIFVAIGLPAIFSKKLAFILALYQFITLILQTAPLRTFVLSRGSSSSALFLSSFSALFGTTALIVFCLSVPGNQVEHRLSEEDGLFNHLFVLWALPLMWKGRKKDFTLDYELHPEMESSDLYRRFKVGWDRERNKHPSHPLLVRALFRAFYPTFLSTVPPAIIRALAQVVQPLLVNAAIKFVSSYGPGSEPQPSQRGWALAGMFALVFLALSGATSLYFYSIAKTGRKALVIRADSVVDATGGDPMNLMSSDVERITTHIDLSHQIWSSFIIIILGLYILYTQLGLGPFVAALPIIFLVLISTPLLSRKIGPLEEDITALCDNRVRLITSILRQIKGVKLSGLGSEVEARVRAARTAELGARKRFWDRFAIVVSLTNTTLNLLSFFTLGTYSIIFFLGHGPPLSTARLFTAYSTLTIISASLFAIGQGLPAVTQAYVSVQRIERYLNSPEAEHQGERDPVYHDSKDIFKFPEADSAVPEKLRSVFLHAESSVSTLPAPSRVERDQTLIFDGAQIAWGNKVVLTGLNASIGLGQLTMVIGRVASGKSTLLATILGETNVMAGRVSFPPEFRRGIAYCSQIPWIQGSLSVRDNICFAAVMDPVWYARVIAACALEVDFVSMPGGDLALARGLSGGQKARVALARAVYSRLDVVVLDDVFAALDPETSSTVFGALFGAEGLLRGKSTVLATNNCEEPYTEFLASNNSTGRLIRENIHRPGSVEQVPTVEIISKDSMEEQNDLCVGEALDSSFDSTTFKTYLHYLRSVGWNRMAIYAILLLGAIGIQVATPVFLQVWSTFNDTHSASQARKRTGVFLGSYAVFEVLYSVSITVLFYYVIMVVTLRASANLHSGLFSALMNTTIEFFGTTNPGQIISRFSQDIFMLDDLFPISFYDFGYQLMRLVGSAVLMIISVPYLAAVVVIVVGVAYFVQKFYLLTAKRLRRLDLASKAPLYTLFQETIDFNGLLTIRAASAENYFIRSNTRLLAPSQLNFYFSTLSSVWFASTIGVMTATLVTRRNINAGLLAVGLTQAYSNLPPEQDTVDTIPDGIWPYAGDVKFTDVVRKIYDKFAIVGRTGGGKSSLLMALLRALHTEGEILALWTAGLDHELMPSGRSLSQGQLQLLAMARALLTVIKSSFHDCTVFAIVHRLENIMDFDQVIVLDAGQIVECGKPSELVQDEDSIFKKLANTHVHS